MTRRAFIQSGLAAGLGTPVLAALKREQMDEAVEILARATREGPVAAAVLHVVQRESSFTRSFGKAANENAMFLLGSISKPICMTALMTFFERGEFKLNDPVGKFLPQFAGDRRGDVTMQHLLTHTSGLPDQLAENNELRSKHAPFSEFVEHTIRTPLQFVPGSKYQYSSMGILLAARIAELISGLDMLTLVGRTVFQPLGMNHSAQGLGRFKLEELMYRAEPQARARNRGVDGPTVFVLGDAVARDFKQGGLRQTGGIPKGLLRLPFRASATVRMRGEA